MRQSFSERGNPDHGAERAALLRAHLKNHGFDGVIIPRADEHQGEYVPAHAERLAWLTGFTGSAGMAAVLPDQAAVFVDGRYTVQVRQQVDTAVFEPVSTVTSSANAWLGEALSAGQIIGFDPWLHTPGDIRRLKPAIEAAGARLEPLDHNPIDAVWADQPLPPLAPAHPHPTSLSGRASEDKRLNVGATLEKAGADAVVLALPDSIAWLLNIRGGDVPHVPVTHCFALLHTDGQVDLFIDDRKIDGDLRAHLGNAVTVTAPNVLGPTLDRLGADGKTVALDAEWTPVWVDNRLRDAGATVKHMADPCQLPKACKTAAELDGMRNAHERDGVAVTRFLAWLAREATGGAIDEIAAAKQLETFREETHDLKDISFESISAVGPNAALPHYRVTERSNRRLEHGTLYLIDSGGQYEDGTTDITRTIAVGTPTEEMRDRFTRVLKGMIGLTLARFPEGTLGIQLDTIARQPLWEIGCDYDHGTGHGVGTYLSVHEGPQSISKRLKNTAMKPGMIVSNEPGFYREGQYGIRIENLIAVTKPETLDGGDRPVLGFETLTLAPIDRTLIIPGMLSDAERHWLNEYHARVYKVIAPKLDGATRAWLQDVTRAL